MILQWAWGVKDLDPTDGAILGHLQRDGRMTNRELAQRVSLSESACSERVKRLEDAGIIAGYCVIVDWRKLGANISARAVVAVEGASRGTLGAFTAFLSASASIASVERSAQPHIFLLHFVGASIAAWDDFLAVAAQAGFPLSVQQFDVVMETMKSPSPVLAASIRRVA